MWRRGDEVEAEARQSFPRRPLVSIVDDGGERAETVKALGWSCIGRVFDNGVFVPPLSAAAFIQLAHSGYVPLCLCRVLTQPSCVGMNQSSLWFVFFSRLRHDCPIQTVLIFPNSSR